MSGYVVNKYYLEPAIHVTMSVSIFDQRRNI